MRYRILLVSVCFALCAYPILAQSGQNQPLYDPNDPIGRVLPPNLHFVIDTSGSMSNPPRTTRYSDMFGLANPIPGSGGQVSKAYITKSAIYNLMSRDNLRVRWSFWAYTTREDETSGRTWRVNDFRKVANDFVDYNNVGSREVVPLRLYDNSNSNLNRRYNTWCYYGSSQNNSDVLTPNQFWDNLLVPISRITNPSDPNYLDRQWFLSSVDPELDNRAEIKKWVDRSEFEFVSNNWRVKWNPTANPPDYGNLLPTSTWGGANWTYTTYGSNDTSRTFNPYYIQDLAFANFTPIGYSLESVLKYNYGEWVSGALADCRYFDYGPTKTLQTINTTNRNTLKDLDPYLDCRYSAILLLSDGIENQITPADLLTYLDTIQRTPYNLDTFVVGFGLQTTSERDQLNRMASSGGTGHAYFADNEDELAAAIESILSRLGSEVSGDTEPILGYIRPDDISFPVFMPPDVELQNVVLKASTTYTPLFRGHLRAFQALTASSQTGKIDFLTDFSQSSQGLLWDLGVNIDNANYATRRVYFADGGAIREFSTTNLGRVQSLAGLSSLTNDQVDAFINWVRAQPLGSVTYSTPAFTGPPNPKLYNMTSYVNWAKNLEDRIPMALIGTNDGMLHCVNMLNGQELWAFIIPAAIEADGTAPARLYTEMYGSGDVTNQWQPDVYGARIYGRRPHYFYMASSPKTMDIREPDGSWHTVCAFGIGAGGNEYYCLDITDPTAAPTLRWRFAGESGHPLGETWSVPALGRFKPTTTDYPLGQFGMAIGSGFNLDPTAPNPSSIGKSFYILNLASTNSTPEVLYSYHLTDSTTTGFGTNPTDRLTSVGNCFFAPPVLFDRPSDSDPYIDKVFIGDYAGRLYRLTMDQTNLGNSTMELYFTTKNRTPIYSAPFVAELYVPNVGRLTFISFTEYGSPIDPTLGQQIPGVAYCVIEERVPAGGTAASLVSSTGTTSSFDVTNSNGFYFEMPNTAKGECTPFRPTLFWNEYAMWMALTSYQFFPGGGTCDPITHTKDAGKSTAYVFDLNTGRYLNAAEPTPLGASGSFYGRASAFHKGARGEGWIDIGTGEAWGWGYSRSTGKFERFDPSKGNITYDMNPTAGVEVRNNYWREFK